LSFCYVYSASLLLLAIIVNLASSNPLVAAALLLSSLLFGLLLELGMGHILVLATLRPVTTWTSLPKPMRSKQTRLHTEPHAGQTATRTPPPAGASHGLTPLLTVRSPTAAVLSHFFSRSSCLALEPRTGHKPAAASPLSGERLRAELSPQSSPFVLFCS
jgi:hypothetical protein